MTNDIQQWAQALLQFENLRFVVIDTTGVKRDSDILRLLILDKHGFIKENFLTVPLRHPKELNTAYTHITLAEMEDAPIFSEVWPDIRSALTGKYVLAYGFDFLQERLDDNAHHYGLQSIHLIGDCLMQTAVQYFRSTNYGMKLVDACKCIGHKLPDRPTAEQRARGQLVLLKAMAEGRTEPPAPTPPIDENEDQLSDLDDAIF